MNGEILFSCDGPVATLTLSNPDKLNAINAEMWQALPALLARLSRLA